MLSNPGGLCITNNAAQDQAISAPLSSGTEQRHHQERPPPAHEAGAASDTCAVHVSCRQHRSHAGPEATAPQANQTQHQRVTRLPGMSKETQTRLWLSTIPPPAQSFSC